MKFSRFFIDRPIFAIVISVITVVLGGIAYFILPVAQFPTIAPPTVVVQAQFPGADPKTLAETVAEPIEQQVNGVENMLYMSSTSSADGTMQLTVTFKLGTDPNIDQVLVQNRVSIAQPQLPPEVNNIGVVTAKQSPDVIMAIALSSKSKAYNPLYLSNYAYTQMEDSLKRIEGVGNIQVYGAKPYSMRMWLDPDLMFSRGLTADDVISALQAQNLEVASGNIGSEPAPPKTEFQFTLSTEGRLVTPAQFSQIVLKHGDNGQLVYLKDVARLELGGQNYTSSTFRDGVIPSVAILIQQLPGSNQLKIAASVKKQLVEMAKAFPPGMEYSIPYDTTRFTEQSIANVYDTLRDAVLLVVIVVLVFLQSWRVALIPLIAVPVSLIGTLAVMAILGFSLNSLSLFGLVLAIGIVVDDAIVVVENVTRWVERGLDPKEATREAMDEVGGAVVAIAVVLTAVFVPTALVSGISGQFYRQFALTIAIATLISAFNSLTLSPALAALLIKPGHVQMDLFSRLIDTVLGWFFRLFNRTFDFGSTVYGALVRRLLRVSGLVLVVYLGLLLLTGFIFQKVPGGFIPTMDQGYLIGFAQLPDGASLQRNDAVRRTIGVNGQKIPGVELTFAIEGLNILDSTTKPNSLTVFHPLKPYSERIDHPDQIRRIYVRNDNGGMVPLGSVLDVHRITGPDTVYHYNVYPAALIQGSTIPGVSSGQAIEKMERICRENLPNQFSFEWTQLTYQQVVAGNTAVFIFPLCVLFVFLALAAQYESWSLPLAVILIVPMCLLSAMVGVYSRGQDNNIFTQIGFIVLVGLACKNAILIVEFARQQMEAGSGRLEAAAEAARLQLRPILMTSFAFILGVLPLVIAKGAGAEMDQALGTAVFFGMLGVTFFGLIFTPIFFSLICRTCGHKPKREREKFPVRKATAEEPVR
jgi:multidrug efflux pump